MTASTEKKNSSPPLTHIHITNILSAMYRPKILIIDDERDLVRLTSKRLKAAGYDVSSHFDGEGAVDTVRRIRPDLILLDIKLPHVSGLDIHNSLSADHDLKEIPIIFFSASAQKKELASHHLKVAAFVTKPYEPADLLAEINRILGGCRER